jgi:hypothetical protein
VASGANPQLKASASPEHKALAFIGSECSTRGINEPLTQSFGIGGECSTHSIGKYLTCGFGIGGERSTCGISEPLTQSLASAVNPKPMALASP